MSITILVLAATAVTVIALFATAVHPALRTAAAGTSSDNTAVGLGASAADTFVNGSRSHAPTRTDWQLATVSDLTDAEDLLDCLENQGFGERELVVLGNSTFAVRLR